MVCGLAHSAWLCMHVLEVFGCVLEHNAYTMLGTQVSYFNNLFCVCTVHV